METIRLRELLEAVHGSLLTQDVPMDTPIYRVETDSRTIHPGALFIPLVGERFDGHAYLNQALEDKKNLLQAAVVQAGHRREKAEHAAPPAERSGISAITDHVGQRE